MSLSTAFPFKLLHTTEDPVRPPGTGSPIMMEELCTLPQPYRQSRSLVSGVQQSEGLNSNAKPAKTHRSEERKDGAGWKLAGKCLMELAGYRPMSRDWAQGLTQCHLLVRPWPVTRGKAVPKKSAGTAELCLGCKLAFIVFPVMPLRDKGCVGGWVVPATVGICSQVSAVKWNT